ncbi:hypothetical protein KSF78_0005122 [Schistosoma japonicum]|nr:hypothetical protein KSF78_0005122 [Schistosoma japonicum]
MKSLIIVITIFLTLTKSAKCSHVFMMITTHPSTSTSKITKSETCSKRNCHKSNMLSLVRFTGKQPEGESLLLAIQFIITSYTANPAMFTEKNSNILNIHIHDRVSTVDNENF